MRLNTYDSVALGELVRKVDTLGAVVTSAIKTQNLDVKAVKDTFGTSAKVANAGGAKIKCVVMLKLGEDVIPYDGDLVVGIENSGSGTTKPVTKVLMRKGYGEFEVEYTGTWANLDTCTITVGTGSTVFGKTVTAETITDTFAE